MSTSSSLKKISSRLAVEQKEETGELVESDLCSLLIYADHDYLATRLLYYNRLPELALYHAQQALEKYLKAFLLSRKRRLKRTELIHDLEELRQKCALDDVFFEDPDLADFCENLTVFNKGGRYPRAGIQSYVYFDLAVWRSLDKYSFEIRRLIPYPENCRNDLDGLCTGEGILTREFRWPQGSFDVEAAFFYANEYFRPHR